MLRKFIVFIFVSEELGFGFVSVCKEEVFFFIRIINIVSNKLSIEYVSF